MIDIKRIIQILNNCLSISPCSTCLHCKRNVKYIYCSELDISVEYHMIPIIEYISLHDITKKYLCDSYDCNIPLEARIKFETLNEYGVKI